MKSSPSPRRVLVGVMTVVLVMAVAGCGGSAHPSASTKVVARVGSLEVIHPFLPDPASPSVAAVYATLRNTGSTSDELVAVSSPVAPSSMLMTENEQGSVGTMGTLKQLVVPAHGQVALAPGHAHAMLEQPTTSFKVGQTISVTLRFARAGSVTVKVPVVPLDALLGGGTGAGSGSGSGGSGGMGNMGGM